MAIVIPDLDNRTGLLEVARRFAEYMGRRNPYLRMMAVSGSLTRAEHRGPHDDIDFFAITGRGRLWQGFMACLWNG